MPERCVCVSLLPHHVYVNTRQMFCFKRYSTRELISSKLIPEDTVYNRHCSLITATDSHMVEAYVIIHTEQNPLRYPLKFKISTILIPNLYWGCSTVHVKQLGKLI